ncbi:hypothetical protein H257_18091 [Aphanomyces astaci]|uniref:CCHC-type domain-containing protein n=1 Tax=Aphanomyces astaci TaxID=112090 RepID=W4FE68_APHAT|nr:hypothetical protein H257_18091 [Aphanomyces astaci]ETV65101.1 hypothetical protein H257_18091 [Aphanomyces astaci]|eukprot:XP_009845404.1 hypothetical protein H257_18091 [Aphanomyces astaci]
MAPGATGTETEEEVSVTEPPLVPVVGGTTDVLTAAMIELAKASKATSSARVASMNWDESRLRYGGQTMGPNWEQLPRPSIECSYINEDYPHPRSPRPKCERTKRWKPEPSYVLNDKIERTEEQRKQAERRRIIKSNRPSKEKGDDRAKVAHAAHDRRMLDTTLPSSSGWGSLSSGPPTLSSGRWGPSINPGGPSLVVTDVQETCKHTVGNLEEITHIHRVDTSSRNEVRRCGPRRPRNQGTHGGPTNQKVQPANKPAPPRHDDRPAQVVRDEACPRFAPARDDRGMLCFVCQQPGHMAPECPNKKDGDSGDTSWKKGKNAVKQFKAKERKANMQAKRMKELPPPNMEDDGRWVRLNCVLSSLLPGHRRRPDIMPQAMMHELQALQPHFKVARLQVDEDGDDLEEIGGDCIELPQRSAVRAASMKAVVPVAKNEVEEALQGMIDGAVGNTFPMEHVKYLWDVLSKHDIWRVKFDGSDPPAQVKPLKVTPKDGCVPYRCKGRKHNLLEERFFNSVNQVLKPDGRKSLKSDDDDVLKNYRLTNDCRVVSSLTEPKVGTMPFQATILHNLRGKKAMGVFDLPKRFWQFPPHPDSWDMPCGQCSLRAIYERGVLQGPALQGILIWIDGIFVYADTVKEYVNALESFFDRVAQFGFKQSPAKTKLLTDQVTWCGDIISGDGVKQDPERIEHLCAIPYPTNAGELQQFVCAMNWLRDSMTEYVQTVGPLQQCLTKALEGKGTQKRIASGVHLELTDSEKQEYEWHPKKAWSVIEKEAYLNCACVREAQLYAYATYGSKYQHGKDKPKRATVVDGLWQVDERLWILSAANDLIQRIMGVAHCGSAGHRGHAALVATIRRLFYVDH